MIQKHETAVLGGGCFWCTEAIFLKLKGVISVKPGYAGGKVINPTYDQVSQGDTGHAEVIEIVFDPTIIPYETLLDIFWHTHDPCSLNKQGADTGTQYRSIILYTTSEQKKIAEESLQTISNSGEFNKPIVTEIQELDKFYNAETYHQNYFAVNPQQPYCQIVIAPKIAHFLEKYSSQLKD